MIKKFVSIKNVGLFADCRARGDVELKPFTLIFGANGKAKTTACDILRSLQSGDAAPLLGRTRLGQADAPEVCIRLEAENANFVGGRWDVSHPAISIFDSTFINQNVFAGDVVDHEQRRNLYRVIVGAQGVALAAAVDRLDERIREAGRELNARRDVVEVFTPAGMSLQAFLGLAPDAEIDRKVADKTAAVAAAQTGPGGHALPFTSGAARHAGEPPARPASLAALRLGVRMLVSPVTSNPATLSVRGRSNFRAGKQARSEARPGLARMTAERR